MTIYVADMDRAVRFYTETLGLRLQYRFGDHWASVQVGNTLTIGLHPISPGSPKGSGGMMIGLELRGSIEEAVRRLEAKGVQFGRVVNDGKAGKFAHFSDPDGNPLYLAELDWGHVNQGEGQYQQAGK